MIGVADLRRDLGLNFCEKIAPLSDFASHRITVVTCYVADAGSLSNSRKYNTFPLMKLQTISDDDEPDPASDYEQMNEAGARVENTHLSHPAGESRLIEHSHCVRRRLKCAFY